MREAPEPRVRETKLGDVLGTCINVLGSQIEEPAEMNAKTHTAVIHKLCKNIDSAIVATFGGKPTKIAYVVAALVHLTILYGAKMEEGFLKITGRQMEWDKERGVDLADIKFVGGTLQ